MLYAYAQFGAAVRVQRCCNDARMLRLDISDTLLQGALLWTYLLMFFCLHANQEFIAGYRCLWGSSFTIATETGHSIQGVHSLASTTQNSM